MSDLALNDAALGRTVAAAGQRWRWLGPVLALLTLGVLMALAALAGVVAETLGVSPTAVNLDAKLLEPGAAGHLLGTDELGRDVLARLLLGARVSLTVGVATSVGATVVGMMLGLWAGYYGGVLDAALMRLTDAMLAIPLLPLLIVLSAVDMAVVTASATLEQGALVAGVVAMGVAGLWMASFRAGHTGGELVKGGLTAALAVFVLLLVCWAGVALGIDWKGMGHSPSGSVVKLVVLMITFGWMSTARLARAMAMQASQLEFVTAARALGASDAHILRVHVFPHALPPVIVAATLEMGAAILYEAALSFLGLGVKPPVPSWGNMLTHAQDYVNSAPLLALWPGLFIVVTVASFNVLGDALRDALDPHQAGRR